MFVQARVYIAELLRPISSHIVIKKNADSNAGLYAGSGLQILFTGNVGIEIINSGKCSSMGTRQEFNCNFNLGGIEFNSYFHRLVTTEGKVYSQENPGGDGEHFSGNLFQTKNTSQRETGKRDESGQGRSF